MTVPEALRLRGRDTSTLQRFLLQGTVFNVALFAGPVLCFVSVLIPALLGNQVFNEVPGMHRDWLVKATDPSVDLVELAADAREIWLSVTKAYYFESLSFGSEYE